MKPSLSLCLALFLVGVGQASAAPGAFRGPYLGDVTTDAITVLWESPTPTTGTVHYGLSSVTEHTAQSPVASQHHELTLTGLSALSAPGSRFVYELEVDGIRYPGSFTTAVAGTAPFNFIALGDNRSSETQHQAVVDALMLELPGIRFAINTGDAVSDGSNESQWDSFFAIEAPFLAQVPMYLVIGNHEVDGSSWDVGERIFQLPTSVAPASGSEAFYHFVYGNAELIVINVETDSLYTGLLAFLAGDQEDWLSNVLSNRPPGVDHRFLFIHQGPYSSKLGRSGNSWLRRWLPELKTAGIDLIVSGHDHYAERGWSSVGIPYVIHGGGGAPLYDTLGPRTTSDHTIVYGESRLGYVLIQVDGPKAQVQIKALSGAIVDAFSYGDSQAPQCQAASDCGAAPTFGCAGGAWECVRSACRYTCPEDSSLIACNPLSDNCPQLLGAQCSGTANCETPSLDPRSWYCSCDIPPECATAQDCSSHPPPVPGCQGTWDCPDGVCEFSPAGLCESSDAGTADAGTETPDLGPPADASSTAPEAGAPTDASGPVADSGSPAEPIDAGPSAPADAAAPTEPAPEESSGCGCAALGRSGNASPLLSVLALGLGLLPGVRRRRQR